MKDIPSARKSKCGHVCQQCKKAISDMGEITQEKLLRNFHYNLETGELRFNFDSLSGRSGEIVTANKIANPGYLCLSINKKPYLVHRVIFMYMTGRWPKYTDHIDHNKVNNRWNNIREVSNRENALNCGIGKNSKTNAVGVTLHKPTNKYRAYIGVNRKQVHLGLFENIQDAITARAEANIKYGYHKNHGKNY